MISTRLNYLWLVHEVSYLLVQGLSVFALPLWRVPFESLSEASRAFAYFSTEATRPASFHISTFLAKSLVHDIILLGLVRGNQVIIFVFDSSVDDNRLELVNTRLSLGGDHEVVTDHAPPSLLFQ